MSKLTKKHRKQLDSLRDAADSGQLGDQLSSFIYYSAYFTQENAHEFPTRQSLQDHIDTLVDLIDTKVHSR